ncbi:MAG: hypothetical protein ACK5L3_12220, partial [Oscillospiraceae bacterium]
MKLTFKDEKGKTTKEYAPAAVAVLNGLLFDGAQRSGLDIKFQADVSMDELKAFFGTPDNLNNFKTAQDYTVQTGIDEKNGTPVYEVQTAAVEYQHCSILASITSELSAP